MGAAAGVVQVPPDLENGNARVSCLLKQLPDAIQDAVNIKERWPVIIDRQEMARSFLRYQRGPFLYADQAADMDKNVLRRSIVGGSRYGSCVCINFQSLEAVDLSIFFDENFFPYQVIQHSMDRQYSQSPEKCKTIYFSRTLL